MYFCIYAKDKPNHLHVRMETRPVHLQYLKEHGDKMLSVGPILGGEDGKSPCGSVLIMEFEDLGEAKAWAAEDPYAKAGLFESTEIHPWILVNPKEL